MKTPSPTETSPAMMALLSQVRQTLDAFKAKAVTQIDMRAHANIMDYLLICTAGSERHARTLGQQLKRMAKQHSQPVQLIGETQGQWVVVDLGDIVVHIMLAATRDYYQIEKMWQVPVSAI